MREMDVNSGHTDHAPAAVANGAAPTAPPGTGRMPSSRATARDGQPLSSLSSRLGPNSLGQTSKLISACLESIDQLKQALRTGRSLAN